LRFSARLKPSPLMVSPLRRECRLWSRRELHRLEERFLRRPKHQAAAPAGGDDQVQSGAGAFEQTGREAGLLRAQAVDHHGQGSCSRDTNASAAARQRLCADVPAAGARNGPPGQRWDRAAGERPVIRHEPSVRERIAVRTATQRVPSQPCHRASHQGSGRQRDRLRSGTRGTFRR